MTSFGKIRVEGPDAEDVLQRICGADIRVPVGRIVYTQFLNARGGIEADLTVTRLAETSFLVVTSGANLTRDLTWIRRNTPEGAACVVMDVTAGEAVFSVMGPKARDLLQPICGQALDNDAFPFGTAQEVELGLGLARLHRVTYVGELGWEVYVPTDMAAHVFEAIEEEGRAHGLKLCGLHVLDSCRIEKAYRHWGHDISDEDHVLEAGLGFAVRPDKEPSRFGDFIGREAVLAKKQQGLSRRLIQFRLTEPDRMLYHNEPVLRDGEIVGHLTSGAYGHHLGAAIGLGYVPCPGESVEEVLRSAYAIEIAGTRIAAQASLRPMYDPKSERVRM